MYKMCNSVYTVHIQFYILWSFLICLGYVNHEQSQIILFRLQLQKENRLRFNTLEVMQFLSSS